MTIGLAIIRIALGLLLMGHGSQKLLGWFGGHGLEGTGAWFESIGHRPGKQMARVAGLSEATGGLLLALGLLTPLGAAIAMGVMFVASSEHWKNGLWVTNGGYELPGFYIVVAWGLAFSGPGGFSLDNAIGLTPWGWGFGIYALALALLVSVPVLARRKRVLEAPYPAEPERADLASDQRRTSV